MRVILGVILGVVLLAGCGCGGDGDSSTRIIKASANVPGAKWLAIDTDGMTCPVELVPTYEEVDGNTVITKLMYYSTEGVPAVRYNHCYTTYTYDGDGNKLSCRYYVTGEPASITDPLYALVPAANLYTINYTYTDGKLTKAVLECDKAEAVRAGYNLYLYETWTYTYSGEQIVRMDHSDSWSVYSSGSWGSTSSVAYHYDYTYDGEGRLIGINKDDAWYRTYMYEQNDVGGVTVSEVLSRSSDIWPEAGTKYVYDDQERLVQLLQGNFQIGSWKLYAAYEYEEEDGEGPKDNKWTELQGYAFMRDPHIWGWAR